MTSRHLLAAWRRLTTSAMLTTLALMAFSSANAAAQASPDTTQAPQDRRFLRPRDLGVIGAGLGASALLSLADVRIARWDQSPGVQGSAGRTRFVNGVTRVNETTLTIAGVAAYGIGRVAQARTLTDVAKHTTEAVVLTSLISQALRGPLGRTRPYVTNDSNQYDFHPLQGFRSYDNRAWPSLHSATAFAAGAALVNELRERHSHALPWAAPLIYAAAAMPGLSRMYLNQHWASDVLAGDALGFVLGSRLVHYAHSSPPGAGPRWLVDATVTPGADGGVLLGFSVQR